MKKLLLIASAILLLGPATSFATTVALSGTYSLSFTATGAGDSNTGVQFSSTPGDGCIKSGGNCTSNLGNTYTTGSSVTNNPFTVNLTVGSNGQSGPAVQSNFFTADPNPSGTGYGACVSACGGTKASNSDNLLQGTITANFTFSEGGATGTLTGVTAVYTANYTGPLSCDTAGTTGFADCVVWNQNTYNVTMSDGDILTVTLANASDWNITPLISFSLAQGTTTTTGNQTPVPEPASIAILASAAAGLGFLRRRKSV